MKFALNTRLSIQFEASCNPSKGSVSIIESRVIFCDPILLNPNPLTAKPEYYLKYFTSAFDDGCAGKSYWFREAANFSEQILVLPLRVPGLETFKIDFCLNVSKL
jgi:hypothetical protein